MTWLLSLMVVCIQTVVIAYLVSSFSSIIFCGDIVRHINTDNSKFTQFFQDEGNDTHSKFKDLWDKNFTEQAKNEIKFERQRTYPAYFKPGVEADSFQTMMFQKGRLQIFKDKDCKNVLNDEGNIAFLSTLLFNKECSEQ